MRKIKEIGYESLVNVNKNFFRWWDYRKFYIIYDLILEVYLIILVIVNIINLFCWVLVFVILSKWMNKYDMRKRW